MQTIKKIFDLYVNDQRIKHLDSILSKTKARLHFKGLSGASSAFIISAISSINKNILVVMPSYEEASYFQNDIDNILGEKSNTLFFPSSFRKSFDFVHPDTNNVLLRTKVLDKISDSKTNNIIISYPEAIAEKIVSKDVFSTKSFDLKLGDDIGIDFLNDFLFDNHFERTDFVYQAGEYAIRGGIVDIFSFSYELPFRIEFFGDQIESIRSFDPETQLSEQKFETVSIVPNVQFINKETLTSSIFDYLNAQTVLCVRDVSFAYDVIERGLSKAIDVYNSLADSDKQAIDFSPEKIFININDIRSLFNTFNIIEFGKQFLFNPTEVVSFNIKPQPSFNKDFAFLQYNLHENIDNQIQNYIFSDNENQIKRLDSIFADIEKNESSKYQQNIFDSVDIALSEGFIDVDLKLACYTDHQIFNRFYKFKTRKSFSSSKAITLKDIRELKPGDYVTHIDHGVGKYMGLERIEVNGHWQEAIRLTYADNDLLYVNINALNRISKFSGKDGVAPKLNKIGSDAWDKLKRNTKKKVKDIARDLITLYAQRKAKKGYSFSQDSYLQTELEASFIYEDTPDQIKATLDIKKDMQSSYPMDRLVCGDVGFGKTEVAIRAAFKAVADSKQVAILVPTTILASQHYRTFKERLKHFPCNVDFLNRFKTPKQIKQTIQNVEEGKVDIVIGTHRLISKDVKFKDLGLLIIDEEQKFGVSIKEKLKKVRVNVDTLTLTATPIPRTLHFSLMGARDLSIINTPPPNRQAITTELHVFNDKIIKEAIDFELERGGQVFFVHNRINDIQDIAGVIQRLCPNVRVTFGHGQMSGDDLEDVMTSFINGEYDVLVATTIIEAGLDIPNANTIIINQAHNFGLSDLHQMRGRVGRSNKKAFCYLLSPPLSLLTSEARKRLSAIEEFSDLGSGFNVAMRDLDIRGSGDLLGSEQSGFISEIGYDMYHKILDEAIQELKNDEFSDLFENEAPKPFVSNTVIDTDFELLIPSDYIYNVQERYNIYTELSKLVNEEELEAFTIRLIDRFGLLPPQVKDLLKTMPLQWLSKRLGFEKVILKKNTFKGVFLTNKQSNYFNSDEFGGVLTAVQKHSAVCRIKETKGVLSLFIDKITSIEKAVNFLSEIIKTINK